MEITEHENSSSAHAQIYLQPIAAPSILGLYGLAGATFMVAAHMAHWFGAGDTHAALYLIPFAAIFGGLAQFLAGMWAYKARDGVATAIHGMWGSFWMAYGLLNVMYAAGRLTPPTGSQTEIGFWFIVLAAITWVSVAAAVAQNRGFVTLLTFLAAGSTTAAVGSILGIPSLMIITGYLFIIASIAAWYTGSALMLEEAFGHEVWGLGKTETAKRMPSVAIGMGEPGVIRGQA